VSDQHPERHPHRDHPEDGGQRVRDSQTDLAGLMSTG
jgi:hypothetical protein